MGMGAGVVGFAGVVTTPGGGTLVPLGGPNFDFAGELESRLLVMSLFRGILPTKGIGFFFDAWGSGVLPFNPTKKEKTLVNFVLLSFTIHILLVHNYS